MARPRSPEESARRSGRVARGGARGRAGAGALSFCDLEPLEKSAEAAREVCTASVRNCRFGYCTHALHSCTCRAHPRLGFDACTRIRITPPVLCSASHLWSGRGRAALRRSSPRRRATGEVEPGCPAEQQQGRAAAQFLLPIHGRAAHGGVPAGWPGKQIRHGLMHRAGLRLPLRPLQPPVV